jgi:hypothetical protein
MARALWLPFEVDSPAFAAAFYTDQLGLSVVDGWSAGDSQGVVPRVADAAYVELASRSAAPPRRYPRGHYGFDVAAPGGIRVMVWSER